MGLTVSEGKGNTASKAPSPLQFPLAVHSAGRRVETSAHHVILQAVAPVVQALELSEGTSHMSNPSSTQLQKFSSISHLLTAYTLRDAEPLLVTT